MDAWRFVGQRSLQKTADAATNEALGKDPVKSFVENWTSNEFAIFVNELADLVNSLGVSPGTDDWSNMERIWSRVIELEVDFWPETGEENA